MHPSQPSHAFITAITCALLFLFYFTFSYCGCNSGSPLGDAIGSVKKELIRLWNSILPDPGQPSAQLSKLIRLTACKRPSIQQGGGLLQFISLLLVVSYETHKGKRWLNSDPHATGGNHIIAITSFPCACDGSDEGLWWQCWGQVMAMKICDGNGDMWWQWLMEICDGNDMWRHLINTLQRMLPNNLHRWKLKASIYFNCL